MIASGCNMVETSAEAAQEIGGTGKGKRENLSGRKRKRENLLELEPMDSTARWIRCKPSEVIQFRTRYCCGERRIFSSREQLEGDYICDYIKANVCKDGNKFHIHSLTKKLTVPLSPAIGLGRILQATTHAYTHTLQYTSFRSSQQLHAAVTLKLAHL